MAEVFRTRWDKVFAAVEMVVRGLPDRRALPTAALGRAGRKAKTLLAFFRWLITEPCHGPFTADEAARELGVTMSTVHRWLREGGVPAGEQLTAGAPRRIVLTETAREHRAGGEVPAGQVGLAEAARRLGVSRPQVVCGLKSGRLAAVRVTVGQRRCWGIDVASATCGNQGGLLERRTARRVRC